MNADRIEEGGYYRSISGWVRLVVRIVERDGVRHAVHRDLPPGKDVFRSPDGMRFGEPDWGPERETRLDSFASLTTEEVEVKT